MTEHSHYVSLDEARALLHERWNDADLKARVVVELGDRFIPAYGAKPLAVIARQLTSPDNGFAFFLQCARYIGATAFATEFLGDMFFSMNEEKMGLGRLRVELEDGSKGMIDIMDFHANEKCSLRQCVTKTGNNLTEFHHGLCRLAGYDMEFFDNTDWYRRIGSPSDYYYPLLLHFVAHAVLFENFCEERGGAETAFTRDVVLPAIERIKATVGLAPLIVRAYPEDQTDEEDFYWWSHSPTVNLYLLDYAREHQLKIKPCGILGKPAQFMGHNDKKSRDVSS